MSSLYPTAYDNFPVDKTNSTPALDLHPEITNDTAAALNAIQTELGLDPRGGYTTIRERLDTIEAAVQGTDGGGNYITNPGFNDGLTGYTSTDTLALSSPGVGKSSVYAGKVTKVGSTGTLSITSARVAIQPSLVYTGSASVRVGSTGLSVFRSATLTVRFYDAVNVLVSTTTGTAVNLSIQNIWARVLVTSVIAPDTAAYVELSVNVASVPVGEYYYFDEFQLEPGSIPTAFNTNIPESALTGLMLAPGSVGIRELAVGSAKVFFGTASAIGTVTGMVDGSVYITTDLPTSAYFYYSSSWHLVAASENTVNNPGLYDLVWTVDPRMQQGNNMTFTANNIYYWRIQGQAEIAGIGYYVGTADGSNTLTFGLFDNTGTGRNAAPNNLKASVTTGVQSGTGFKTVNFSSPVVANHGDWFGASTASTTLALMRAAATSVNNIALGLALMQSGGGPTMPNPVSASLFADQRTCILIGV